MAVKEVAKKPAAKKPAAKKPAAKKPVASIKVPAKVAAPKAKAPAAKKPAPKKTAAKKAVEAGIEIKAVSAQALKEILAAFQSGGVTRSAGTGAKLTQANKEVLARVAKRLGVAPGTLAAAVLTAFLAGQE